VEDVSSSDSSLLSSSKVSDNLCDFLNFIDSFFEWSLAFLENAFDLGDCDDEFSDELLSLDDESEDSDSSEEDSSDEMNDKEADLLETDFWESELDKDVVSGDLDLKFF